MKKYWRNKEFQLSKKKPFDIKYHEINSLSASIDAYWFFQFTISHVNTESHINDGNSSSTHSRSSSTLFHTSFNNVHVYHKKNVKNPWIVWWWKRWREQQQRKKRRMKITLFHNVSYLNLIYGNHSHPPRRKKNVKLEFVNSRAPPSAAPSYNVSGPLYCKLLSETRSFTTFCMLGLWLALAWYTQERDVFSSWRVKLAVRLDQQTWAVKNMLKLLSLTLDSVITKHSGYLMLITRNCSPQETTQAKPHCGSGQGFSFIRCFKLLFDPPQPVAMETERKKSRPIMRRSKHSRERWEFSFCLAKTEASKGAEQIDKLIYCQHASEYQQLPPAESTWKGQRNFYTHLRIPLSLILHNSLSRSLQNCRHFHYTTAQHQQRRHNTKRRREISENLCFQLPFAFMAFDIFTLLLLARRLCVIDGSILWVEFVAAAVFWCWGETK